MEKTTKKKKSKRGLRKRIGIIAVGGLSLVLTVCLSVGATLAWFAGSTWASKSLYMGGPVYVEMAGSGIANGAESPEGSADWKGGYGSLNISPSKRTVGTADDNSNVLLPGQKMLVYSQARVYSTAETTTEKSGAYANESSGSDNGNVTGGKGDVYYSAKGKTQTSTTSVLRAQFSINIEFDPSNGFNNFTDKAYAEGYPVQSTNYKGAIGSDLGTSGEAAKTSDLPWEGALGAAHYVVNATVATNGAVGSNETLTVSSTSTGRRDAVDNPEVSATVPTGTQATYNAKVNTWVTGESSADMWQVKNGVSKCIRKWKYVSKDEYENTNDKLKVPAPFDGNYNNAGGKSAKNGGSGNGYYAIFYGTVTTADGGTVTATYQESDAFYKARTTSYLKSYVEHYVDNRGRDLKLCIGDSLETLEDALNESFKNLITESSDNIWDGYVLGFKATEEGLITKGEQVKDGVKASWLYVDPVIGNDTNAGDSATSVGGWWYLVESEGGKTSSGSQTIKTEYDKVTGTNASVTTKSDSTGIVSYNFSDIPADAKSEPEAGTSFKRKEDDTSNGIANDDPKILDAKLYEIVPDFTNKLIATANDGTKTTKVVSYSFPFVNGNFELPGKELTNIFANAKISFQISFEAIQAFFPYTTTIDSIASGTPITGMAKALSIRNAIPVYNEAFDYVSNLNTSTR